VVKQERRAIGKAQVVLAVSCARRQAVGFAVCAQVARMIRVGKVMQRRTAK
jgi:hypothetical protein